MKGNGDLIAEAEGIVNLNMYKYKPNEDAINLQSLLIKLPQEGIEDSLQTVANFPLETSRWPPRLFVYYIGMSLMNVFRIGPKSLRVQSLNYLSSVLTFDESLIQKRQEKAFQTMVDITPSAMCLWQRTELMVQM